MILRIIVALGFLVAGPALAQDQLRTSKAAPFFVLGPPGESVSKAGVFQVLTVPGESVSKVSVFLVLSNAQSSPAMFGRPANGLSSIRCN